jgi:hypothetical protein
MNYVSINLRIRMYSYYLWDRVATYPHTLPPVIVIPLFFVPLGDMDILEHILALGAALINVIYLTGLPNKLPF